MALDVAKGAAWVGSDSGELTRVEASTASGHKAPVLSLLPVRGPIQQQKLLLASCCPFGARPPRSLCDCPQLRNGYFSDRFWPAAPSSRVEPWHLHREHTLHLPGMMPRAGLSWAGLQAAVCPATTGAMA